MFVSSVIDHLVYARGRLLMPPSDNVSYDAMIKDNYHARAILNSLNDENHAQAMMEEVEGDTTQGRKHIIPKRIGRNWSVGSIPRKGALPQAGRSFWGKSEITVRNVYLRCGVDEWVMNETRNDKGAFDEIWTREMDGAVEDAAFVRNRMAWGTGLGILAKVNGNQASVTTVELKDPGGVPGTVMANRFIQGDSNGGMFVNILDGSTPTTIKGYGIVTGTSTDGTDMTLDTAVTVSDGDLVVMAQSPTQNSYNVEPTGILGAVDDGTYVATYHGVVRSAVPIEKAHVVTGVGTISFDAIQQGEDAVSIKVGKGPDLYGMEHAVARAIIALTEVDRRYTGADLMSPDGGSKRNKKPSGTGGLVIGGKKCLIDRDAPYGMLFGLRKATFIRLTWPNSGWADKGGGVLKWVDGFDEFTAYWHLFEEYHNLEPVRNFRLEGITVNQIPVKSF
jgi:hypothetical protein